MQLSRRFFRAFVVTFIIFLSPIAFYLLALAVVIIVSISQIGQNSGNAGPHFIASLSPVASFLAGLVIGGGFTAFINALATPKGWWLKSNFISALVGGLVVANVDGLDNALLLLTKPYQTFLAGIIKH